MKEYEIKLADWQRILFGQVPPEFYVEAALRIVFIYLLVVFSMRKMGNKISGNLSRNEMAATIAIAAAIGIPVHTPERGLIPAVIVALIVISGQRLISHLAARNNKFEHRILGRISTLVNDGVLCIEEMVKCRLSQDRVFSELRSHGFRHLGHVKRLYFEANGTFSLVQSSNPLPGLCIIPDIDPEFIAEQNYCTDVQVCITCGKGKDDMPGCDNCGSDVFTTAVV